MRLLLHPLIFLQRTMTTNAYGTFSGELFRYPIPGGFSLAAFESAPSRPNKVILIGGLSDGLIPVPYAGALDVVCRNAGWSLVQPVLSSSYQGFGSGSLARDSGEISSLIQYLSDERGLLKVAAVGHSTGCQNIVHFLRYGTAFSKKKMVACALQAPVSDREGPNLKPPYEENIRIARSLIDSGKGEEMMPRASFWAPITADRFFSLQGKGGVDDLFSSDLSDTELKERLGHVEEVLNDNDPRAKMLVAYSKKDEYAPNHVDRHLILKRLCDAIGKKGNVAIPLMLEKGNHNLSEGESDADQFIDAFAAILESFK